MCLGSENVLNYSATT